MPVVYEHVRKVFQRGEHCGASSRSRSPQLGGKGLDSGQQNEAMERCLELGEYEAESGLSSRRTYVWILIS